MDTSLFTDPDTFFQRRSENPGLFRPLIIVFLAAIASAGTLTVLFQTLSGEVPGIILGIVAVLMFLRFIRQFFAWIVFAIVFYLISIAVDGDGSLGDTFKLIGWGFIPQLILGVISTITTYIAVQATEIPTFAQNIDIQDQQQLSEASSKLAEYQSVIDSHLAVRIIVVLSLLFLIWQLVIWVFAVKHARDLTTRGGVISVAIPVGLYLLYRIYNLLTAGII
jgi:hypothetical protein